MPGPVVIDVDGVPTDHYAAQLIVLGTPRPEGRPVDLTTLAGVPLVVRDPATQAVFVPITLTGEAAGLSQVFLTPEPEGLATVDGGPVSKWSTSQFAEMLARATAAEARAGEAAVSATDAAAIAGGANEAANRAAGDAALAAADARATLEAARALTGSGGGYAPPAGGIPFADLAPSAVVREVVVQNADGTWTPSAQTTRPRDFVLRLPGTPRPANGALLNGGTLRTVADTTVKLADRVVLEAEPAPA